MGWRCQVATTEHLTPTQARRVQDHDEDCKFRIAATCSVAIECDCELKRDVCPVCDPCTCKDALGNVVPKEVP